MIIPIKLCKKNLPGHLCVLQALVILSDPAHVFPPLSGAGLSQFRERVSIPPPHVFEQAPYHPHMPQLPFTGKCVRKVLNDINVMYRLFYHLENSRPFTLALYYNMIMKS